MKSLFNNIQTIIIVVLVVVIILLRECKNGKEPEPEIERIVKIETKYDTIVKNVPTYIPEYRTRVVTKTIHDTVKLIHILNLCKLHILIIILMQSLSP